jgi:5-methylcytosine-specific restriction enzyme A
MPYAPARPCRHPGCPRLTHEQYCAQHEPLYPAFVRYPDTRPSSARRGYDATWRKIREEVLRSHGIPREAWPLYDVDHRPAYDPAKEPDHRKYTLVPTLHAEHSRKTAREDGGWGHRKGGGRQSLGPVAPDRIVEATFRTTDSKHKGVEGET